MKSVRLCIVAAALGAVALSASTAHAQHDPEYYYKDGVAEMKEQNYSRAMSSFERAHSRSGTENPKYLTAVCEAAAHGGARFSGDITKWCDRAMKVAKGTPYEARIRAALKIPLAREMERLARSAERSRKSQDYDRAIKAYTEIAQKMDRPSDWLVLCSTQVEAAEVAGARVSCGKVTGKLTGEARKLLAEAAALPSPAQQKALDEVGRLAPRGDDVTQVSSTSPYVQCAAAAAAARKLGVKDEHWVPVGNDEWKGYPTRSAEKLRGGTQYWVRFGAVAKLCEQRAEQVKAAVALDGLERAHKQLEALAQGKDFGEHGHIYLATQLDACRAGVDKAIAGGASPAAVLDVYGTRVELGKARAQLCDTLAAKIAEHQAAKEARKAAELEAKLAPYRKVLKGDKMKTFASYEMWSSDMEVLGKGGYQLVKPADFAKASKWFRWSASEDNRGRPIWEMEIHVFRGHKLVKTQQKRGRGTEPPNKAFR